MPNAQMFRHLMTRAALALTLATGLGADLLPGSYWFQPGGVPHAEDCLGPEICQVFVVFDEAADFTPVR